MEAKPFSSKVLITLAGMPATRELGGTMVPLVTTAPAATMEPLPITAPSKTVECIPIKQWSSTVQACSRAQ